MTGLALLERVKSDESSCGSIKILTRPSAKIELEIQPREWGVGRSADLLLLFEVVLFVLDEIIESYFSTFINTEYG